MSEDAGQAFFQNVVWKDVVQAESGPIKMKGIDLDSIQAREPWSISSMFEKKALENAPEDTLSNYPAICWESVFGGNGFSRDKETNLLSIQILNILFSDQFINRFGSLVT